MEPLILATARKHGAHDDDILHAYRNPVRVLVLEDLVMRSARTAPASSSKSV